jgi:hypothetical protein
MGPPRSTLNESESQTENLGSTLSIYRDLSQFHRSEDALALLALDLAQESPAEQFETAHRLEDHQ